MNLKVKDWPNKERPRERLIKQGVESLSESELIAIILRTGYAKQNVVELAKSILKKYNLRELSLATYEEMNQFKGVSKAKACQLLACFEISKRLSVQSAAKKKFIESSEDVASIVFPKLRFIKKEKFMGIYLDSRNSVIKIETISVGNLNSSVIHPRELFKAAIQSSANSVIIAHNHPSGNPSPSKEDIYITKKIVSAGKVVGIPVLDHIIIGEEDYISMAEKNLVNF
ncbi:MAG: hypothetical protein MAG795_01105 [Candidatus Woesearchaeota archaeon]|nr:hypothetical protein [Candidatus Woesearchaeota archaeon]